MWFCDPYRYFCLLFSFIIYLFGCTRSWSQHTGSSLFIGTYEIFSCRMWDLLPRPAMEPRLAALGALSPSHWTTREVLTFIYFWLEFQLSVIIQVSLTDQIFWSEVFYRSAWARLLSCVQLFVAPWTVACQAPLPMEFQVRILEWVASSFSRGSSRPRDQPRVSQNLRQILLQSVPPGKPHMNMHHYLSPLSSPEESFQMYFCSQ